MASQITSQTTINSTVYSSVDQRKHQSSASLPFLRGIHRCTVNSPHKGPVTRKMFPFDDVIMTGHNKFNEINIMKYSPIIHLLPIYFVQTRGMLGRQYVSKGVCRCWHCRVSTTWPWRMWADRLPWCRHSCLSLYNRYRNRHRNLWDGQCVSSWRPLVCLGHLW